MSFLLIIVMLSSGCGGVTSEPVAQFVPSTSVSRTYSTYAKNAPMFRQVFGQVKDVISKTVVGGQRQCSQLCSYEEECRFWSMTDRFANATCTLARRLIPSKEQSGTCNTGPGESIVFARVSFDKNDIGVKSDVDLRHEALDTLKDYLIDHDEWTAPQCPKWNEEMEELQLKIAELQRKIDICGKNGPGRGTSSSSGNVPSSPPKVLVTTPTPQNALSTGIKDPIDKPPTVSTQGPTTIASPTPSGSNVTSTLSTDSSTVTLTSQGTSTTSTTGTTTTTTLSDPIDTTASHSTETTIVQASSPAVATSLEAGSSSKSSTFLSTAEAPTLTSTTTTALSTTTFPTPAPTKTYKGVTFPSSVNCDKNTCACPTSQYLVLTAERYFASGLMLRWASDDIGWDVFGGGSDYLLVGDQARSVTCLELSDWYKSQGCTLPFIVNGHYGKQNLICEKGISKSVLYVGQEKKRPTENEILVCHYTTGFKYNNVKAYLVSVTCN